MRCSCRRDVVPLVWLRSPRDPVSDLSRAGHVEFNEIVRVLNTVRRSGHPASLPLLFPLLSVSHVALNRNESTSISISCSVSMFGRAFRLCAPASSDLIQTLATAVTSLLRCACPRLHNTGDSWQECTQKALKAVHWGRIECDTLCVFTGLTR